MIVREIIKHPELLETFDWFNDYHDTRLFVEEHHPDMLPQFLAAYLSSGAKWGKSEGDHQIAAQGTPAGRLLCRMGWDYWNTESSARRVAEHAAAEIETLRTERDSLAAAVLAWWKDHQFDECCDRNMYPDDPPFVTLAQRITEPPANIS